MNLALKATHVCKIQACITSAIWISATNEGKKNVRNGHIGQTSYLDKNNIFSPKDIYFDNIQIVFR